MRLNEISDNPGATKTKKRVGRGIASGSGKTAGKGHKGQKARSGVSLMAFEGGQMPVYRRLPKRGFNNANFTRDFAELNVGLLQEAIDNKRVDASSPITTATLLAAGVIRKKKDGLRLLGNGELKAKVEIEVEGASKGAIAAVEKAGGKVTVKAPAKVEETGRAKKGPKGKNARRVQEGGDATDESKTEE